MKKILLIIAFVAGTISFGMAQQGGSQRGGTPEEKAQRMADALKSLNLSADQQTQVKAILIAQFKSQDSIRTAAGQNADRQAMMQQMKPIREASDKKILAVLNEDQKKAFLAWQEERRQNMGQGGQRNGAPKQ